MTAFWSVQELKNTLYRDSTSSSYFQIYNIPISLLGRSAAITNYIYKCDAFRYQITITWI